MKQDIDDYSLAAVTDVSYENRPWLDKSVFPREYVYKNTGVILVNLKINSNKLIYIPYKALNTQGIIPCIKPDKVLINEYEVNNCLIGLAKDKFNIGDCNCILPNSIKEDL